MINTSTGYEQNIRVFVTYCWAQQDGHKKVLTFVNKLREDGFFAECDLMIMQRENNLTRVMSIGLSYDKVIVVCSEEYKQRADSQNVSGVETEATIISTKHRQEPDKFCFVSLDALTKINVNNITPLMFSGERIIDLTSTSVIDGYNWLLSRLKNEDVVPILPVSEELYYLSI